MIYIDRFEFEQTKSDKQRINYIYHLNAIHYVVSGFGYFNGMRLGAGDGFVCLRNSHVDYYPDKDDPWAYYWARISGDGINDNTCFCSSDRHIFSFDVSSFDNIGQFVLVNSSKLPDNRMFSGGCYNLLISEHVNPHATAPGITEQYVERTKDYINSNYHKKITMEEIAKHLSLSRAYLRNIFYRQEGMSPQQYLINTRMERAKELLSYGSYNISEIAVSVGYSDSMQFYKMFKKHTGMSPTNFKTR